MKRDMRKMEERNAHKHGEKAMSDELSAEELEQQEASELPDREAMSLINANVAIPVNAAIAANILSDGANAGALAQQSGQIGQTT